VLRVWGIGRKEAAGSGGAGSWPTIAAVVTAARAERMTASPDSRSSIENKPGQLLTAAERGGGISDQKESHVEVLSMEGD